MKRFLLWSFERGSRPYDAICAVILAFIFLTPSRLFHDRPDFMRIEENEPVRRSMDSSGNVVYTVQLNTSSFMADSSTEKAAVDRLREVVHEKFEIARTVPIYSTAGILVAYAIWIHSGVPV